MPKSFISLCYRIFLSCSFYFLRVRSKRNLDWAWETHVCVLRLMIQPTDRCVTKYIRDNMREWNLNILIFLVVETESRWREKKLGRARICYRILFFLRSRTITCTPLTFLLEKLGVSECIPRINFQTRTCICKRNQKRTDFSLSIRTIW